MGRSILQGTPWHEEVHYTNKAKSKIGSTRCASNINNKCTCNVSIFHNESCGGSKKCKEYSYKGNYTKIYK